MTEKISKTDSMIGSFITKNLKTIITCIVFICGVYLQYQASMMKIEQMEKEVAQIKVQIESQYVKLDNMKLDKAVFEATMKQFTDMTTDIREIRERLEDVLADHQRHNPDAKK